MGCSLAFYYFGIILLRWNYQTNNGNTVADLPIYCFQIVSLFLGQVYLVIVMYQVKRNLSVINFENVRASIELFDTSLEVYQEIVTLFGKVIILNLFNLLIVITFSIFVGFVLGKLNVAIYEHLMWEWIWLVLIYCIHSMNRTSCKVNMKVNSSIYLLNG